MKRKDFMFMSHEELFSEGAKQIAIVADGLTPEETKNALDFIRKLVTEGKVKKPGFRNVKPRAGVFKEENTKPFSIGFSLHECKRWYPAGNNEGKSDEQILEECNAVEFLRILPIDEVWFFDNGKNWLPVNGRLYERLKALNKPIRYLCRVENNTSWDFYRSLEWKINEEENTIEEDWCFIGELEPCEWTPEELEEMKNKEPKHIRSVNKDELNEDEYNLIFDAFRLNTRAEAYATVCMVRLHHEACTNLHNLMCEISSVIFGILTVDSASKELLKHSRAKLDFLEADIEDVMNSTEEVSDNS